MSSSGNAVGITGAYIRDAQDVTLQRRRILTYLDILRGGDTHTPNGNELYLTSLFGLREVFEITGSIGAGYSILSCPNGHIEAPPMDLSGDFTIEWFMKIKPGNWDFQDVFTILYDDGSQYFLNCSEGPDYPGVIITVFDDPVFVLEPPAIDTTVWNHYAICNTNGQLTQYINGSLAAGPVVFTQQNPSGIIQIGYYEGDDPFIGSITNFRITLSALYTGITYTIPSLPLSGGDLLILRSGTTDSSGKNVPLTIVGTPTWTQGPITVAPPLFFPYGVLSNVNFDAGTITLSSEFTIEFFGKLDVGNQGKIEIVNINDGSLYFTLLQVGPDINIASSEFVTIPSGPLYYHYAICGKSDQVALYINGARATSKVPYSVNPGSTLYIGTDSFTGSITNFRLTNGQALYGDIYEIPSLPLSGGDLLLLGKENAIVTDSSGNDVTVTGTADWSKGPISVASPLSFQLYGVLSGFSSTSFIAVPSQTITGAFTIEAFVGFTDTSIPQTLFSIGTFVVYISGGDVFLKVGDTSTNIGPVPSGLVGSLAHVALSGNTGVPPGGRIVRASGTPASVGVYINGSIVGTPYTATPLVLTGDLQIGYSTEGALGGSLTNFMISTSVLYTGETVTVPSLPLSGGTFLLTCSPGAPYENTGTGGSTVTPPATPLIVDPVTPSSPQPPAFPQYGILTGFSRPDSLLWYPSFGDLGDNFTLEFFFKYLYVNPGQIMVLFGLTPSFIDAYIQDGNLLLQSENGRLSTSVTPNTWYHFSLTRQVVDTVTTWYTSINGVSVVVDLGVVDVTNTSLCIGDFVTTTPASFSTGSITNFRISSTALYTTNFSVPVPPLSDANATLLLLAKPGDKFADSSNAPHTSTTTCGWAEGPIPNYPYYGALSFTEDSLRVDTTSLSFTDITIEWFARPTDTAACGFFQMSNSEEFIGCDFYDGKLRLFENTGGTQSLTYDVSDALTWYHYAICRKSGVTSIFVNGSRIATGITLNSTFSGDTLQVGDFDGIRMKGSLTNFRISDSALYSSGAYIIPSLPLSGGSVLLIAKPGAALKESNGLTVTGYAVSCLGPISVAPTLGVRGFFYGFSLSDYISVPAPSLADFTIEAFVKIGNTDNQAILSLGGSSFAMKLDSGNLSVSDTTLQSCGTIPLNIWTHIAVSRVGSTAQVYINGVSVKTYTSSADLSSTTLYVGICEGSPAFKGSITNIRLSDTALYTGSTCSTASPLTGGQILLLADPGASFIDSSGGTVTKYGSPGSDSEPYILSQF